MITFLDLYNEITGQAWSMFDGDVESIDEFESAVTTSIQKALNDLWCSYKFPFRNKTQNIKVKNGTISYSAPNGQIAQKTVKYKKVYGVKIGTHFLSYEPDYEILDMSKTGTPTKFYVKNDRIFLYPVPDANYSLQVEYWSFFPACDENGISKQTLDEEKDYIDIPEKYEAMFKAALLPLCMVYAIASESDENYSAYKKQYENAYKILCDYSCGLDIKKKYGWK